jgi:hypothetical protein
MRSDPKQMSLAESIGPVPYFGWYFSERVFTHNVRTVLYVP